MVAAYHQHLFAARIDMAVDCAEGGKNLVVSEVRTPAGQLSVLLPT